MTSPHLLTTSSRVEHFDVVIIGAGVLGLSTAFQLSGSHRVLVVDKERFPAVHASGKNAGMFRHLYRSKQLTKWAGSSCRGWPDQLRELAVEPGCSCIRGREVPEHSEGLFEQIGDSVICSKDALIDPGQYNQVLHQLAKERGAEFKFDFEVCEISAGYQLVSSKGEKVSASIIVNAAGAWAGSLINSPVSIRAYARHLFVLHGQINVLKKYSWFWDEKDNYYMRRWGHDQMLYSLCDKEPTTPETYSPGAERSKQVAEKLLSVYPEEASEIELRRSWHCFRAYTEDQLPVFGEDPEHEGFFWLAGFGGFGMSTSWGASEDLAKLVSGEQALVHRSVFADRYYRKK